MQEYYKKFYSGKIKIPDYSAQCPICGKANCACYHGYYTRAVICPIIGLSVNDFPVIRFKCNDSDKPQKDDHVTFSLLPIELVPFRQLSLCFMILSFWLRVNNKISLVKAMDNIEQVNSLADIGDFICVSNQIAWEKIVRTAFKLFLSSGFYIRYEIHFLEQKHVNNNELLQFIEFAMMHHLEAGGNSIRGPDALAFEYFNSTNTFLFGIASQHRK